MQKRVFAFLMIFAMFSYGCAQPAPEANGDVQEEVQEQPAPDEGEQAIIVPEEEVTKPQEEPIEKSPTWEYGGPAIGGNYDDSDFVELGSGKYRMYYAIEPEVPGNKLEVYSATSSDGVKWVPESGVRRTFTVFPDVVKLPDGRWRM